ncbi:hypothetical protein HZC09_06340 [Candidatus Micrarchaeota archaeon]|nr:hypothetical protein [Candidatus Micrarchaeota archaeon]
MSKREPIIFLGLLALVLLIPYAMITVLKVGVAVAIFTLLLIVIIAFLSPRVQEIKEYERGVMFAFGKFDKVLPPGWHVIFPAMHSVERVDTRTQVLDIEPQEVITKEDIKLKIDAVAYIRIIDAKKSVIEVQNIKSAVSSTLHGELRTQIGKLPLQEVLEKTEELNKHLYNQLKQVEDDWGMKALNVEIINIELPPALEAAFRKKQEAIEHKEKIATEATARKEAIRIVNEATKEIDQKTLAYLYLDALKRIADGKSNKILFPIELTHLATVLAGELGKRGKKVDAEDIAKELLDAYLNKQKEILDNAPEKQPGKKKKAA